MDIHDTQACSHCLNSINTSFLIKLTCEHLICHACVFRNFYLSQTEALTSYITTHVLKVNCFQCSYGYCTIVPSELIEWITVKEAQESSKCKKHQKTAEHYCQQCERIFCPECISIHNDLGNSHHKLTNNTRQRQLRCPMHDSKLKLFCVSCKKAICSCCVSLNHNQHPVKHLKEFSSEALENIALLKGCDIRRMLDCITDSMTEFNDIYEKGYKEAIKQIDNVLRYFINLKEDYTQKMKEMQNIQLEINALLAASYQKIITELNDINMVNDMNQIMFYNDIWLNMQLPIELPSPRYENLNTYRKPSNKNSFNINQMTPLHTESKMETLPDSIDLNNEYLFYHKRRHSQRSPYKPDNSIFNNKETSITCFKTLSPSKSQVKCLLELPDGKLVSGSFKEIRVWDNKKGFQCVQTLQGHSGYINSLSINTEGNLTSLGEDNIMLIWDIQTYRLLNTLKEQTKATKSLILLSDGKIASISGDNIINIRNPKENYSCVQSLIGHKDRITAIIMIKKQFIASSSLDSTIRIWKPKSDSQLYEQKWVLKEHAQGVNAIIEMSDGNHFLSCSNDLTIKLWSVADEFSCVSTFTAHKGCVTSLLLLTDGSIASSSTDGSIKLWKQQC